MRRRSSTLLILVLLATTAASGSREVTPSPSPRAAAAATLSPDVEAQLQTIKRLRNSRSPRSGPDPRLFGALLRLEEILPRSQATRRAQERGRRAYLAMINGRSLTLSKGWPAMRKSIELTMREDKTYQYAIDALDRRLARDAAQPAAAVRSPAVSKRGTLPFDQMRPGDIMIWDDRSGPPLVRVAISLFASKCTHSAIYLGETSSRAHGMVRWTLEAHSPALGVRQSVMGRKWLRPGLHVALGHVQGISPARAAQITSAALEAYGGDGRTPYHVWPPWDKTYYQEGVYCSQLVWSIYNKSGVDLDSNDWHYLAWFTVHNWFNPYAAPTAYFAVFPDEIKASPHVTWYYDQVNP